MLKNSKVSLAVLALGLTIVSCQKETELNEVTSPASSMNSFQMSSDVENTPVLEMQQGLLKELPEVGHNLREDMSPAVDASPCGTTNFVQVQNYYFGLLGNDLVPIFGVDGANYLFGLYMDLNFYYAYLDRGEQYFGADGKYTNFMVKRQRELEKFWDMPNEVRINGQHTATLNDREKLADIWELVGVEVNSREEAYAIADQYLFYNSLASTLPESPFFALDGFATPSNLIVVGDGIVQMLTEAGVEEDIAWTGIVSHEWGHQIQFNHTTSWYPEGANADPVAATRHTELEADFFSAYFMTHKRGATYNWKRVEEFFELFVNIGDCSFDSANHHGTPAQRLRAARLGYDLANSAHKQGHVLSIDELHSFFMENVEGLL
ncbi:MAG: hypothetical protein WBL21_14140 [Salinimicrobium sp.]